MPAEKPAHPPNKSWLRITITASETISDPIADFICEQTGGVEQIPVASANAAQEQIVGYLENDPHAPEKLEKISAYLEELAHLASEEGKTRLETEVIPDEDWNKTWKEGFKPLPITAHLVIKPTWESYQPSPGEKVIEMDPGMAFGTGHHASTKLALEFVEGLFHGTKTPPKTVLDVGTGTGILAMAAALLAPRRCWPSTMTQKPWWWRMRISCATISTQPLMQMASPWKTSLGNSILSSPTSFMIRSLNLQPALPHVWPQKAGLSWQES